MNRFYRQSFTNQEITYLKSHSQQALELEFDTGFQSSYFLHNCTVMTLPQSYPFLQRTYTFSPHTQHI